MHLRSVKRMPRATPVTSFCKLQGSMAKQAHPHQRMYVPLPSTGSPAHDVHITELPLANTLLLDAVTKGRARFVSDCTSYLHSCVHPAGDIFISSSRPIASIVVLPLIYGGTVLGALYFTKDSASNFQVGGGGGMAAAAGCTRPGSAAMLGLRPWCMFCCWVLLSAPSPRLISGCCTLAS